MTLLDFNWICKSSVVSIQINWIFTGFFQTLLEFNCIFKSSTVVIQINWIFTGFIQRCEKPNPENNWNPVFFRETSTFVAKS
jgi:hypothetical protein